MTIQSMPEQHRPAADDMARAFARRYPFNDYRAYDSLRGEAARKWLAGEITERLEDPRTLGWSMGDAESPAGLAFLSPLEWDTEFFGAKLAQLRLLLSYSGADVPRRLASDSVRAVVDSARERGFEHLSVRVDVEDLATIHALGENGFLWMDTLQTYVSESGDPTRPSRLSERYRIRPYVDADRDALMDVAARSFTGYRNRYANDPWLSQERVRELYPTWARNSFSGAMASRVLVAERAGRPVGFLAWRINAGVERHTGLKIMGGGLGACLRVRFDAYLDLLGEANRIAAEEADLSDYETQVFNVTTIRFYQQLGFRYARAKHAFHRWIGPTPH